MAIPTLMFILPCSMPDTHRRLRALAVVRCGAVVPLAAVSLSGCTVRRGDSRVQLQLACNCSISATDSHRYQLACLGRPVVQQPSARPVLGQSPTFTWHLDFGPHPPWSVVGVSVPPTSDPQGGPDAIPRPPGPPPFGLRQLDGGAGARPCPI